MPARSEMTGVRKMSGLFMRYQALAALAVILCLAASALGANPFAGETVAPFDLLLSYPGWSSVPAGGGPLNTQPSDILDSLLPVWITLKEQVWEGKGALWHPNGAGGVPISLELGNPAFWLFVLVRDNALAFYLVGLAKLVIAGFGCYLLLRIFLRWPASIWGGMVYMLCGFNSAWFYWDQVTTAMWIPWLLWATISYLTSDNIRWLPVIAVVSLLLILGGFPAVAAFGFYSFALLLLTWLLLERFRLFRNGRSGREIVHAHVVKRAGLPLLAVGIAFVMSAFTLVPFIENMGQINLSYRANTGSSFDGIRDLLLFLTWETPLKVERTAYIGWPVVFFTFVGMALVFRSNDDRLRRYAAAMLVLVVLGIAVLFGFVPETLVRLLPAFSSNHWSRMIVIPLLGLAVLSSIGLELLSSRMEDHGSRFKISPARARQTVRVIVLVVLGAQFSLQKDLFNTYNVVVPSAWFYPATPSISYVKERLRPLESVIADNSYMVAGTLGAYGIPEWYAHAYRTDREKEALGRLVESPFASPTAAFIDGSAIQFTSRLMDQLAVRYLLLRRDWHERKVMLSLPEFSPVTAPSLTAGPWRQHLYVPDDATIGAFGFQFLTGGNKHAPADVRLSLFNGRGEKYTIEPRLAAQDISDAQWSFFEFPDKVKLLKGSYLLVLSMIDQIGDGDTLSAAASRMPSIAGTYLERDGGTSDISLNMRIGTYARIDLGPVQKKWEMIDIEENIIILENREVGRGAYHVKGLDATKDLPDFTDIEVSQPSAHLVSITYSKQTPGWVVLPMHLHPGWKAYIDGRRVPTDTYLEILPAIPVRGPAEIEFRFEPASSVRGAMISSAGLALFLLFAWFCASKNRSSAIFNKEGEKR